MAITPSCFYLRDNATINAITFTGSTAGSTTLTTSGSPALAVGMVVWASGATYLGVITAGSANSWTLSASSTVASQTMVAFAGMAAGSVGWSSVTAWAPSTAYTVGQLRRQKNIACVFTAGTGGALSTTLTIASITSGAVAPTQSLFYAGSSTTPPAMSAYGTSTGGTGTMTLSAAQTIATGTVMVSTLTPGNERVFVCTTAGTSGSTEPTWTLTRNSTTTDNTVTWRECTGHPALNGDTTYAGVWTASSSASSTANTTGGTVILNTAKTHVFICTSGSASTSTTEPTWNTTTGATTTEGSLTWTCLGSVGSFGSWAAPAARLTNMLATTWGQASNSIFLGADHAEVQPTAISITSINGTPASPNYVISVAAATVPPTSASWSAGASVTTVGPNSLTINVASGGLFVYGSTLSGGSGATTSSVSFGGSHVAADTCIFAKASTSASSISTGSTAANTEILLTAPVFKFGNVGDSINPMGRVRIQNISTLLAAGSATPTNLFSPGTSGFGVYGEIVGCDLSSIGAGTVWGTSTLTNVGMIGCKLGSSTVVNASRSSGSIIDAINCDSAATDYQKARYAYAGTLTTETSVVRTSGAVVDVMHVSDKIATNAVTSWINPFSSIPLAIWNATTGSSVTVTVYGVYNGAALPNNDELWMEVEYPGSASSPLVSISTTTKANAMTTAAAVTSDTSAWDSVATARANSTAYALGDARSVSSNTGRIFFCTTAGTSSGSLPAGYASAVDGGSVTDGTAVFRAGERFKLTSTFTPQLAGPVYVRIKAGRVSSTWYVDPLPVLS